MAPSLERWRNGQREAERVRLDAVAQQREGGGHVVAHALVRGDITGGEERLPERHRDA